MLDIKGLINKEQFGAIASEYKRRYGYGLILFASNEILFDKCSYYDWRSYKIEQFEKMINEAVRWGEPNISIDLNEVYIWCVPVCLNNFPMGGFFSASYLPGEEKQREKRVREAAWGLLEIVEKQNLCPTSLMQLNRMTSMMNARMAEAIHLAKGIYYQNPRDIYMIEEQSLINAVKNGRFERAREIINKILVGVYHLGKHNFDVLKALILEMVVQMYRALVEEGADPKNLLGVNSSYLADFGRIRNEVELSDWLTNWLESFIKTTVDTSRSSIPASLSVAIKYIKSNIRKPLSRDEVAHVCNLSPAYFSRVLKLRTGYNFTELVNKLRIDYACLLFDTTDKNVSEVCFDAGFNDQSYFTKVFKKLVGISPKNYRKTHKHNRSSYILKH